MGRAWEWTTALARPDVQMDLRPDGSVVLSSRDGLRPGARCIGEWVERWAVERAGGTALAERLDDRSWRRLTWSGLRAAMGCVAQGLLDLGLRPGHRS